MSETSRWSERMADSVIQRRPVLAEKWAYEWGVVLKGIEQVWLNSGQHRYFDYLRHNVDQFVQPDGSIRTYRQDEYNLDQINTGKLLFRLWRETGDTRYRLAIEHLRDQLRIHPRTSENGFWHKQIYPSQMWLDGIYMHGSFLAEYARTCSDPASADEVAHQIVLIERHTRDLQSGLLYHGWDESKTQRWANPESGCSPHFWGRAMGWFMMALADVLEILPADHTQRETLTGIFGRSAAALLRVQDETSGLWFQVLDQGRRAGNYLEASASCMITYALAKGARTHSLPSSLSADARRAYQGILDQFVETDAQGLVNLNRICGVAGLGGNPYRDGSYDYYIGEKIVTNDDKGVGAFILASAEIERA